MEANLEVVEYRVVLIDPGSRKVLGHTEGSVFHLLRVSIPARTRVARQLRVELLRRWGIGVVVLDLLSFGEDDTPCAVAELLKTNPPVHFPAVRVDEIPDDELSELERTQLLRVLGNDATNPFSRVGWMEEAIAWVESTTGRSVCSKAGVEQYNAGATFTLLHFSMEGGQSYWLKATGAPNSHERHVTRLLSTLCPSCLPRIVAEKPEWNAWLMTGEAGDLISLPTDPKDLLRLLGQVVRSLAELQIKTVGRESLLFDAGALDQRLDVIRTNANGLFAYIAEAMSLQTSTKVPCIEADRLKEMQEIFEKLCDRVERLGIPSTILHGDMNLGNLLFTEERCQLIDWCEGYVGHPLVTFQHILLLNPTEDLAVKAWVTDALKEIYFAAMSTICDPRNLTEGFTWMGFLAAASALYGRGNWPSADLRGDSARLGYARSIARHMDRSAREPAFMKALCC
jgi:aminoglycoside phosphotransferase